MIKIIITSLALLMILNNKAFAYLDPGTGSIILQALEISSNENYNHISVKS